MKTTTVFRLIVLLTSFFCIPLRAERVQYTPKSWVSQLLAKNVEGSNKLAKRVLKEDNGNFINATLMLIQNNHYNDQALVKALYSSINATLGTIGQRQAVKVADVLEEWLLDDYLLKAPHLIEFLLKNLEGESLARLRKTARYYQDQDFA